MPSLADLSKMPMNQPMTYYNLWKQSISLEKAETDVLSFIPFIRPSPAFAPPKVPEEDKSTVSNITTYLTNGFQRATAAIFDQQRKSTAAVEKTPVVEEKQEKDPYGDRAWQVAQVPLLKDGDRRYLNEFSIRHLDKNANGTVEQNKTDNALVMLHGYGAGLAFFYRNFEPLSRRQGWTLYALDMLGMGRSARPPFKIHAKNDRDKVSEAEDWFIDAIEEWRVIRQLPQFTLVAHSMGGYMATAYALKYPGRLKKLILVSPVGVPVYPHPETSTASAAPQGDLVEPTYADAKKATRAASAQSTSSAVASSPKPKKKPSFLRRKKTSRPGSAKSSDSQSDLSQEGSQSVSRENSEAESSDGERPLSGDGTNPPRRRMPKWAAYLWSTNVSPFSIIRWSGPLGAGLVSMWTERRFAYLPRKEVDALHAYTYSLCRSAGSGEYAITYILAPGVFAHAPLIERMHMLGRQKYTRDGVEGKEHGLPVVFLYGDVDWMDKQGGYGSVRRLEKSQRKALKDASERDKALENGAAKVIVVKHAGHHVHLDGAEEFNEIVTKEMMDVEERDARLAAIH